MNTISIIVPTYKRERLLVNTLRGLTSLASPGDEVIVIDQSPSHEPETAQALRELESSGAIRYYLRRKPSQNEAMNVGALLARNEFLVFLDDDIEPASSLLEAHRAALSGKDQPAAVCGQVLQPWNAEPVDTVQDFDLSFDCAYAREASVRHLMGANFSIARSIYLAAGGMDENFTGANYRNDAELAYRVCQVTGRRIRFVPHASVRHLLAPGGNRAFGAKDTWGHIGGSIGDYYFALKWLPPRQKIAHVAKRLIRASINRNTVTHPWLVPSMALREIVAFFQATTRLVTSPHRGVRTLHEYGISTFSKDGAADAVVPA
jgi:glycosyltransferase involved in cell wall biosynthesis